MPSTPPIIVIGGGHAGIEAAHAAARAGCDVLMITLKKSALVRLSCNPAIGGIGKGHLVREIDALGGVMGLAADLAGIHFRVLNRSRGAAVRGPRIQQDHERYPQTATKLLEHPQLEVFEGEAAELIVEHGRVAGVLTACGRRFPASAVVLTTGTFLRGKMFQGEKAEPGGRVGEPAAVRMSESLRAAGLRLGRFKTGTPPRIVAESLDFSRFEAQPGDADPEPFSFVHLSHDRFEPCLPQTITYLAYTNEHVHETVRSGLDRSPLYTGAVDSKGPRYCPSFEDKVVKFPHKDSHLLHLEPMGLEHPWIYLNGLSTSLPPELQTELVQRIPGLESAEIARFGYAVEYDYVPPTQLRGSLEVRNLPGLFLAGQICGTTGYEEAAGLGLVAGVNAVMSARKLSPWVPDRLRSYLGVMVDDLTTRGVIEPYRMFTSRAEMRLSLSADTADRRLSGLGEQLGIVDADRARKAKVRWQKIEHVLSAIDGKPLKSSAEVPGDRIRRGEDPGPVLADAAPETADWAARDRETLVSQIRYRGYLEREQRDAVKLAKAESIRIPRGFDFETVVGLSSEARQRLAEVNPCSVGQAARIPGVTPAAVALLSAAIGQRRAAS